MTTQTITMADSYAVEEPTFTMVGKGYTGAEGPVFNQNGEFYMVASEVEVDGKSAGQILQVNTSTGEVGPQQVVSHHSILGTSVKCSSNNNRPIEGQRI